MEDEIRLLLFKYGIARVHEALPQICRQMYLELSAIYGSPTTIDTAVKVESPEENVIFFPLTPSVHSMCDEDDTEPPSPIELEEPPCPQDEESVEESAEESAKEIVLPKRVIKKKKAAQEESQPVPLNELVKVTKEPTADSLWADKQQDIKDRHRKTIQDKFEELSAKGVDPNTLLTKESLKSWLDDGKGYNQIAREVGLHEAIVSKAAKEFGLESKINRADLMKWVKKGKRGGR
jgi:hypothetical protein